MVVWPDNDIAGADCAGLVIDELLALDCEVFLLYPARLDLAVGEDCVDWLRRCLASQTIKIMETVEDAARSVLRQEESQNGHRQREAIEAGKVELAALMENVVSLVRQHVVCDSHTADAVALWIAFTWVFEGFDFAPIALITAPEKRCGKSTMLDFIERLARAPLQASNITPAALFRAVEHFRPTLLLDEFDSFVHANEELRGVINSGHKRTGSVVRTVGPHHEPKHFSTWCPKALAGIGRPPPTIVDRSITLRLKRKRREQTVRRLRESSRELESLRTQLGLLPDKSLQPPP